MTLKPENIETVSLKVNLKSWHSIGNVSEKDGKIFVHAHIVLSGQDYLCFGGHLMAGTKIFAAELSASPIPGALPRREFDPLTGLALWSPD